MQGETPLFISVDLDIVMVFKNHVLLNRLISLSIVLKRTIWIK